MVKVRMRDIVPLLPGITGSVLQKDGKDIWAVSGQTVWKALTSLVLYQDRFCQLVYRL